MNKANNFSTTAQILKNRKNLSESPSIRYEYQYYGEYLAKQLHDEKHLSLYIKLAKEHKRAKLDQALFFVKEVNKPKNIAALFLWKLGELNKKV